MSERGVKDEVCGTVVVKCCAEGDSTWQKLVKIVLSCAASSHTQVLLSQTSHAISLLLALQCIQLPLAMFVLLTFAMMVACYSTALIQAV